MNKAELQRLLEEKCKLYNQPEFIASDPVSIPHLFTQKQDIEITGLFAATLAWGQRKTILSNCHKLIEGMDNDPYHFIINHKEKDLARFEGFCHRTFNYTDLLYFFAFLKDFYQKNESLETAFTQGMKATDKNVENGLNGFKQLFFSLPDFPQRTMKHISSPAQKSACKRLNMYLRWMVRADAQGVDFGIWKNICPDQLVIPLDVHVHRVARFLGLINNPQADWKAATELTEKLKAFDAKDPVRLDYALFGMGVDERMGKLRV